jgi:hypothetical protein
MVTEQGKWLDGEPIFFEQTSETQHEAGGSGFSPLSPDVNHLSCERVAVFKGIGLGDNL